MKILIITYIILSGFYVSAQTLVTVCDATPYNLTSTNPDNPVNDNLPTVNANRYLNGFDWNQQPNIYLTNMMFDGQALDVKTSLVHSQLGSYYSYLYYQSPGHLLPQSEGWELLLVNVGKYPDDATNMESVVFRALPYVVLYNKYSAIIRVFVGMGPDATISESADALSVKLSFINGSNLNVNYNGLLRLYDGHDSPLDQPISSKQALSIGKAITEGVRWASVDFQTAYDPCSCNTPTQLNLEFSHIKEQELELYGRSVGETDYDIMTNEMGVNPKDFLSSVSYDGTNASQGLAISKALQNTLDDYESRYKKYQDDLAAHNERNDFVNRNLGYIKFAKYAIATVQTVSGGFTSGLLPTILKSGGAQYAIDYLASANYNSYTIPEEADWYKSTIKAFPNLIKKITESEEKIDEKVFYDVVKFLMGSDAKTFISNNLETTTDPNQPAKPTNSVTYTEMSFSGKITSKSDKIGPTFFAPGTYGEDRGNFDAQLDGNDAFLYPIYNELLGTFVLLESPKIAVSKTVPTDVVNEIMQNNEYLNNGHYSNNLYRHQTWSKQYQVKLTSPLKYAFNNTLDIKNYTIKASFEIKARPKKIGSNTVIQSSAFVEKSKTINLYAKNVNEADYLPVETTGNPYNYNVGVMSPTFNFNVPVPQAVNKIPEISFSSVVLPLDAFMPMVTEFSVRNEVVSFRHNDISATPSTLGNNYNYSTLSNGTVYFNNLNQLPGLPATSDANTFGYEFDYDISLKLIVDVTFNSLNTVGQNNTATMVLTYPIAWNPANTSTQAISSSVVNIGQYPQNLNLANVNFDGNPVQGCVLTGNTYQCKAWDKVYITDDLISSNGYKAVITGGSEVTVQDESVVSPEITLSIEPVLDYSTAMPEATDLYVKGFCRGTNPNASSYLANTPQKSALMQDETVSNIVENEEFNTSFDFSLFPNPTSGEVEIQFNKDIESSEIILTDISGKILSTPVSKIGNSNLNIDLEAFSSGIYFVKVATLSGTVTKQIVKR